MKKASITYSLQSWLFDEERKAGDTTVIEDATSHRYYVLGFEDRYLDKARSADARILMTKEDGQAVLDEWKNGAGCEPPCGCWDLNSGPLDRQSVPWLDSCRTMFPAACWSSSCLTEPCAMNLWHTRKPRFRF